jgi:uncharacterized protein involved in exopolysaccharide biosynthesis
MSQHIDPAMSLDPDFQPWPPVGSGISWSELGAPIARNWRSMIAVAALASAAGIGASYLIAPTFQSVTTFLPPQQQQSSAASALASLGALAGLAGVGGSTKSPADEYVGLMQSVTVADRIVDRFQLMTIYRSKFRDEARRQLASRTLISVGKKDGLISVQAEDTDPKRAADIANQYVEELRRMTSVLAVSEAQQRRVFFEKQMQEVSQRLAIAQAALGRSGFDESALKAEPKAIADAYARVKAQLAANEVSLQGLRTSLAESSPDVRQKIAVRDALQAQLADLERSAARSPAQPNSDFIDKYREFKYQEALSEVMARQYEIARVDEAREGALVQVVDIAKPAERKSAPKRLYIGVGAGIAGLLIYAALILTKARRRALRDTIGR